MRRGLRKNRSELQKAQNTESSLQKDVFYYKTDPHTWQRLQAKDRAGQPVLSAPTSGFGPTVPVPEGQGPRAVTQCFWAHRA